MTRGPLINAYRYCHLSNRRLLCPCNYARQCPMGDSGFYNALVAYLHSSRGVRSLWGREARGFDSSPVGRPGVTDIGTLFDNYDWVDPVYRHIETGQRTMTRALCNQLQAARRTWFTRFSPPGYRWQGMTARDWQQRRDDARHPPKRKEKKLKSKPWKPMRPMMPAVRQMIMRRESGGNLYV